MNKHEVQLMFDSRAKQLIEFCISDDDGQIARMSDLLPPVSFFIFAELKREAKFQLKLDSVSDSSTEDPGARLASLLVMGLHFANKGLLSAPRDLQEYLRDEAPTSYWLRLYERSQAIPEPELKYLLYYAFCLDQLLTFRDEFSQIFKDNSFFATQDNQISKSLNALLNAQTSAQFARSNMTEVNTYDAMPELYNTFRVLRQQQIARKKRPSNLRIRIDEIVKLNYRITELELLERLSEEVNPNGPIVQVTDEEIQFLNNEGHVDHAAVTGLKDHLSKAKKARKKKNTSIE